MRETVLDGQNTLSMTLSHIRTTNLHSSYEDLNTPILEPNNNIYSYFIPSLHPKKLHRTRLYYSLNLLL